VAKCAVVYALRKEQLETVAGTLPSEILRKVDRALCIALGLPATRD
jgi:hypothetical protein